MKRSSILVAHPWMGRGGSEATAMWTLEALQDDYDLAFTSASPVDWDALNRIYGTRVCPERIAFLKAPSLPGAKGPQRLVHLQRRWFERHCHRIASGYDLSLSAYNPIWFGRPAIQLVGDFSFDEEMRKRLYIHGKGHLRHRDSVVRSLYLALGEEIGLKRPPLAEWGDLVLANSAWAARQLEVHFRLCDPGILHPPVALPSRRMVSDREPDAFVCLGRIVPEKEIERIVRILARVREAGFPVVLRLVGNFDESDYSRRLAASFAPHRDWIEMPGYLDHAEKQDFLARHTFGIHACRIEAFGIAVAEMAALGCVPFVPASGGSSEIVNFPDLRFGDDDEAFAKITALLSDRSRVAELSRALPERVARFGPDRFVERLREIVVEFADARRCHRHATA